MLTLNICNVTMCYTEFHNAAYANVFNLCFHFNNPVNQHIVRFEVFTELVMNLEVFCEIISYCLVTIS